MRVCFFGTYREEYSRNKIVLGSLHNAGIDVVECHESLWHGIEDRADIVSGGWLKPKFWYRLVITYSRLLRKYRKIGDYDVLMVGYPGHFDVFLANLLRKKRSKPLVWDVLMSLYLICVERELDKNNAFVVRLIKSIEKKSLNQADLMYIESEHYAGWFNQTYGVPLVRFCYLPLGTDETIFNLDGYDKQPGDSLPLKVFYYGGFLPSHGVEVVIETARNLRDNQNIQFELAGVGPELEKCKKAAAGLTNILFSGYLEQNVLLERIRKADICLGVFGQTPQALMTVQNRLFECLALGKCVISGESQAVREVFRHGEEIWLCERSAEGLTRAIEHLASDPKLIRSLGLRGAQRVSKNYGFQALGAILRQDLEGLLKNSGDELIQKRQAGG